MAQVDGLGDMLKAKSHAVVGEKAGDSWKLII